MSEVLLIYDAIIWDDSGGDIFRRKCGECG